MGDITKDFSAHEFYCPCTDCIAGGRPVKISVELVEKLQAIRDMTGIPMRVNSGVRCEAHNRAIGGSPKSSHLLGLAADIRFGDTNQAFDIVDAALRIGFMRIGSYRTFIHLDVDSDKPQRRLW